MKANSYTKHGSTLFLRGVVLFMAGIALLLCYLILPTINNEWEQAYPTFAGWKYVLMILLAATTIPFFIALFQTLKLLDYVDKNQAFSRLSIKAMKYIKYCAASFSLFYMAILPFIRIIADKVDAPGVMLIGFVIAFVPMVIAVFAAVLEKLLQNAVDIKSENDLTV